MSRSKSSIKQINNKARLKDVTLIALFTSVLAVCAWICLPLPVPVTFQTFGIMMCAYCLGAFRGSIAVLVYVILGILGIPVFSSFSGGISHIFGITGGYILGFFPCVILTGILLKISKSCRYKKTSAFISMLVGNVVCYITGVAFYVAVYMSENVTEGIWIGLLTCVLPYIIPDLLKILLAVYVSEKIKLVLDK